MKLIDDKGRILGKINIFDLIFILAVIVIVGAVGYKLTKNNQEEKNVPVAKTYIVSVKAAAMPDTFAENLEKDKRIYYTAEDFVNATIVGIREVPAVIEVQTSDGKLVNAESPNLKDVYIDLEVKDISKEPDIRIGKTAVAVGFKLNIKTIYAAAIDCIVLDIKEK